MHDERLELSEVIKSNLKIYYGPSEKPLTDEHSKSQDDDNCPKKIQDIIELMYRVYTEVLKWNSQVVLEIF